MMSLSTYLLKFPWPKSIKKTFRYIWVLSAILFLFYVSGRLSNYTPTIRGFGTMIWLLSGLNLGLFVIGSWKAVPLMFLGSLIFNLSSQTSPWDSLGFAAAATLEATLEGYPMLRFAKIDFALERTRDVVWFLIFSLIPNFSFFLGSALLGYTKDFSLLSLTSPWYSWWSGDALGDLLVAPFICTWFNFFIKKTPRKISKVKIIEAMALASITSLTVWAIFGGPPSEAYTPIALPLFPLIIWTALRFGPSGVTTWTLLVSNLIVIFTLSYHGPLASLSDPKSFMLLHIYIATFSISGLLLSASTAEKIQAASDAKRAVENRDTFLSLASHELKTPVTTLKLQLHLAERNLKSNSLPPQLSRAIQSSTKQVSRISTLLDDLLDITRIQSGKFQIDSKVINLSKLVQDTLDSLAEQIAAAHCTLVTDIAPYIFVLGDPDRLENVLVNFITNALKYAPGKPLKATVARFDHEVRVSLKDQGPGIPTEHQNCIFEKFNRGQASQNISGLGLGLYISRNIIDAHHGHIYVLSKDGEGSEFIFTLPTSEGLPVPLHDVKP